MDNIDQTGSDPDETRDSGEDHTRTSDETRNASSKDHSVTSTHTSDGKNSTSKTLPQVAGYKILGILGEGGMGIVYEAEQQNPKRLVALKVIRGGQLADENYLRMFQREVETLARLKHANIGAIYESGRTEDGLPFFAMEIVRGRTLSKYLRDSTPPKGLTPAEVRARLTLFYKIAETVQYAHRRGVIHRDLKPSNIIVTEEKRADSGTLSAIPEIKILDFGLARITDTDIHMTQVSEIGVIKGTLAYMSPEQARGNPDEIDVRSDVYSLGVIFYEMLSGALPKKIPASMLEALRVITEDQANPLGQIYRGVKRLDSDVETICHKALELVPDDRYGSAAAMAEDIERYLTNQPIQARPPSTIYQLKKLVSRNKLSTVFVATVALLLVGLAVTMSVLRGEAEDARAEAQKRADELEVVTEFQSSMLSDIDAEAMGLALFADLSDQIRESLEADSISPKVLESDVAAFNASLNRINATNVALTLLDKQVLQRAVETIDEEFAEQPAVRAALQQTVGDTYEKIGLYPQALPLLTKALETRRRVLGEDNSETLISINNMGMLLEDIGKYDEALSYQQEALETSRRVLGDDHPLTLSMISNMGELLQSMGKYDEAFPYLKEALDSKRRVLGNDDSSTLTTVNNIGVLLYLMGRNDEALPYFQEDLDNSRRNLGDDHPETLTSINNMSVLLNEMGRYDEAFSYIKEALDTRRRVLGDDHPETLSSIGNMGGLLQSMGKYDEALLYYQEVLESRRRILGDDHPSTLITISNIGELFQEMGKNDEALIYYKEALESSRSNLGNDHTNTLISIMNMGILLCDMDKLDDALLYSNEAVDGFTRISGENDFNTLIAISHLGYLHVDRSEHEKAIALLEPIESTVREKFIGGHISRLGSYLSALGQAQAAEGAFDKAETNLKEAYTILSEANKSKSTTEVLTTLVSLFEDRDNANPGQGHDLKAEKWRTRLAEFQAESETTN